jgi:hypothetical protein
MFTAKAIKDLMNKHPFTPFRLHLSGGSSYEVVNHDAALVFRNFVEIGVNPDPDGILEKPVRCAIIHISRIEDLQPA